LAFSCFAIINWTVLFFAQDHLEIDPINHSILSLIFPVHKLPSHEIDSKVQKKTMFWMVLVGNSSLLLFHFTIYCIYFFKVYSPWSYSNSTKLLVPEDLYRNINPLVIALFLAASIPVLLANCVRIQR
jgi:hypothetical protein